MEKKRNAMSKEKEEYEKKIEYVKKKQKEIIQKARNKANMIKGITKILIYVVLLVIFWELQLCLQLELGKSRI